MCHPVLAMVTCTVFGRVALRTFLFGKGWVILTLIILIVATAGLRLGPSLEPTAAAAARFRTPVAVMLRGARCAESVRGGRFAALWSTISRPFAVHLGVLWRVWVGPVGCVTPPPRVSPLMMAI